MYFADISIINSGVRETYVHVYHPVTDSHTYVTGLPKSGTIPQDLKFNVQLDIKATL